MALKTYALESEVDAKIHKLYDNMKCVVWIVKVVTPKAKHHRFATGFCVSRDGFILTSAYRLDGASKISVRSFYSDCFVAARRVDRASKDAGLALLKIDKECDYAQMGDDVGLTPGMEVFGIGHQTDFYFTFLTGKLVSTLKGRFEIGIKTKGLRDYIDTLSPDLRFLEIHGFESMFEMTWMMQTLGAPVFNLRGCVIGMVVAVSGGFDYMLPSTRLRKFLEETSPTQPGGARSGVGSSRQSSY